MQPPPIGPEDVVLALPVVRPHLRAERAVAYHGACGVLVDRFEPVETLAAIATNRVSVVQEPVRGLYTDMADCRRWPRASPPCASR